MCGVFYKIGPGPVSAIAALGLSVAASVSVPAGGADATRTPPDTAERVQRSLERYCSACREIGLGSSLSLDDLARDPSFVIAKQPDASRVYQHLLDLQRAVPSGSGPASETRPAPADVEIVRDWIAGLPDVEDVCTGRKAVAVETAQELAAQWLTSLSDVQAADTRFISLAHLHSTCMPEARLAQSREAVRHLLAALAGRTEPANLETLGEASALLAIRLNEVGLSSERWAELTQGAPPFVAPAIPGDWLAARVLGHEALLAAPLPPEHETRVRALAHAWRRALDLRRAAAEMGLERGTLAQRLTSYSGDSEGDARRLVQGLISRERWSALRAKLEGAVPPRLIAARDASHIDVGLWTDKPSYTAGDLMSVNVTVDRACYLTVIDVAQDGKAIVLYPNDFERDNLVAPGVIVKVPGARAQYQLRFDRRGRETIVAQCQRSGPRMEGLVVDYEKQRFTLLGDWRTFLRTSAEREEARARTLQSRAQKGRRGQDGDPVEPPSQLDNSEAVGRAAVTVAIE